jgi:pyrroline-5-carboxylate reductase
MNLRSISLLGCGNMGLILLKSLVSLPGVLPGEVSACDPDASARKRAAHYGVRTALSARECVQDKGLVVIAVKPQNVVSLIEEIRGGIDREALLVSIVAGFPIDRLQLLLGWKAKIARAMPNTPSQIKKGMTALTYSPEVSTEEKAFTRRMFNRIGKTAVVPESQMDAVTALSGSGPAYLFTFVEALVAGGISAGLSEQVAFQLVSQTIFGSIKMLIKSGFTPGEQIKKVASPGGTTQAGLLALETGGFREAVISAVGAAARRAAELGKGQA